MPGGSKKRRRRAQKQEGTRARSARKRAIRREAARADKDKRAQARFDYLQAISDSSRRRSARAKILPVFRAVEAAELSRARRLSASRRRRAVASKATVSVGGLFDLAVTKPKLVAQRKPRSKPATRSKSKPAARRPRAQTRRRKTAKSGSPQFRPAHVVRAEELEGMGPRPRALSPAQKKRQQAQFDEAVRLGEILPGDLERNKTERYKNYLDRLRRKMEHSGPTYDVDGGDLVLPMGNLHGQRAHAARRARIRGRPGTLFVPGVSKHMGAQPFLERHTGVGRPVGRARDPDVRTRKKSPGGFTRMWDERPGDRGR